MTDRDVLAEVFDQNRTHLQAVAYRMLGSQTEAEDAVQETWMRLMGTDAAVVNNLTGWLTTVVGRVCVDMLRARRARREDLSGPWLPEPVVRAAEMTEPEGAALLADSVSLALLVVLETLSPAERLSFVLHDMFDVPFEEIAPIVAKSPAAARQLASRARRRVRGSVREPEPDPATQRSVVNAFLAASRNGDFDALLTILDPDVVFRIDAGDRSPLTQPPVVGARQVARAVIEHARFTRLGRPVIVNGSLGLMVGPSDAPAGVAGLTIVGDRITAIDVITDPAKLGRGHVN
jgi:RNA polymerase sigma-70 factor, ECF subfamily